MGSGRNARPRSARWGYPPATAYSNRSRSGRWDITGRQPRHGTRGRCFNSRVAMPKDPESRSMPRRRSAGIRRRPRPAMPTARPVWASVMKREPARPPIRRRRLRAIARRRTEATPEPCGIWATSISMEKAQFAIRPRRLGYTDWRRMEETSPQCGCLGNACWKGMARRRTPPPPRAGSARRPKLRTPNPCWR